MTLLIPGFDFDSTIADTSSLWHLIDRESGQMDWRAYGHECAKHATEGPAYPFARYLSDKRDPWFICSGRNEESREESLKWLHDRKLFPWAVFLCDDRHNYMEHGEWKAMRLAEIQRDNDWEIPFFVDDISAVATAIDQHPELWFPTILVHAIGAVADHLG